MPTNGKEYKLAIRIAGVVDKSYNLALTKAGTELKTAEKTIKSFEQRIGKMDSAFREMDKGFNTVMNVGKKCFDVLARAAEVAALAVGSVTIAAAKIGSDFEAEMSVVQAISQATDKDLDALAKKAREVGKTSVFSATEVGKGMEYMGMAGWKTEEILAGISGVVNLAAASGEDMANVSSIVVDTLTAMGKTADSTSEFVDVLAQAAMNSNTNVELMGETFKYAAPVAGALGYDFKDLAIATGLMASSGIKGSLAGTALRNMLTRMAKPTKESRDAMEKLGLSLEDEEGKAYSLMDIMLKLRSSFADSTDPEGMAAALSSLGGLTDEQIEEYKAGLGEMSTAEEAFYAAELGGQRGMSGLLALANSSDEQFQQLVKSIYEAEGAVDRMAGVRLDNLQGDVVILKDAVKDAGIEWYYQFNDELRNGVQWLTEIVNSAATKIPAFFNKISTTFPTINRKFKQYVGPVIDIVWNFGKSILKNGKAIISIISGIGAALIGYKVVSNTVHFINALTKLTPTSLALAGVTAAIGAMVSAYVAYKQYEREMIDKDLADHFGNIALSMEELSSVADYIIRTDNLGKVKESLDAFNDLDTYVSNIEDALEQLNKLNWKVSIGMELTEEDKEAYKTAIDNYVQNVKDYILQENYAVDIGFSAFLDPNNEEDMKFQTKVDNFYSFNYKTLESLGEQLAQAVTDGFDNNFKLDDVKHIQTIQQQMAAIQRNLAVDEYDVSLTLLGAEFSGAALDPETFKNLQDKLKESAFEAEKAYYESYAKIQTALDKLHNAPGGISDEEYQTQSAANKATMEKGIRDTNLKALEFQLNTIYDTYGTDIENFQTRIKEILDEFGAPERQGIWEDNPAGIWMAIMDQWVNESDDVIDGFRRSAIFELLEPMQEQMEIFDKMFDAWDTLDDDEKARLLSIKSRLSAVRGATAEEWQGLFSSGEGDLSGLQEYIANTVMSTDDYRFIKDWLGNYYEEYTGISLKQAGIQPYIATVAEDVQEVINEEFSKGFYANAELHVALSPDLSIMSMSEINSSSLPLAWKNKLIHEINGHANGGFVWNRELSWLGEKGPEAVIPLDGSSRATSLWENTGKLLGMGSIADRYDFSGVASGNGTRIEYSPTLQFYGEAPSRQDLDDALRMSQDEFEAMMEQYLKRNSRVAFR